MQYWFSLASHIEGLLGIVIVEADSPTEAITKVREIAPEAVKNAVSPSQVKPKTSHPPESKREE
jgi:hypothetical protein